MTMTPVTAPKELVGIQGLRGVAALLVIFVHYNGTAAAHGFAFPLLDGVVVGHIGVDIFFVISGFIMEITAGSRPYRPGAIKTFLIRRAVRVLPLLWALTLVSFAAAAVLGAAVNRRPGAWELFMSMLLLPATGADGLGTWVVPVAWSLSYELYFYLLFALLLRFSSERRLALLLAWFGLSCALGWFLGIRQPIAHIATDPILFEFFAGCVVANFYRRGWRLSRTASYSLALAALALVLRGVHELPPDILRSLVWGLPALMLVTSVVLARHSGPTRLQGPFIYLGDISYSLYLSHVFALAILGRLADRMLPLAPSVMAPLMVFVTLAMVIGIAHLCFATIETPSRHWLSRKFIVPYTAAPAGEQNAAA